MTPRRALAVALGLSLAGCQAEESKPRGVEPSPRASAASAVSVGPPALLYLPDGGDVALEGARPPAAELLLRGAGRCPPEMVDVAARFCIDRYEASLVDTRQGRDLSPYFVPRRGDVRAQLSTFREGAPAGAPAMPRIPAFQLEEEFAPRATSRALVVPNGYVSGVLAREACTNAGKRLCTHAEWVTACRGERGRQFPYGERYEAVACNVGREAHPASVLYGNASLNHLDPRLNLVKGSAGPLLRRTGETESCRSEWGTDAIFDMVGNLDEWVDDPSGAFAGGFFSRATKNGCDARVTEHPPEYFDYSTGVRCCL